MNNSSINIKEIVSNNRTMLMGLAMIAVMLFHQHWLNSILLLPFRMYGFWGVDIFLFVSGFGCVYSYGKHSICDFFRRRFVRLVPVCLYLGVLFFVICQFVPSEIIPRPIDYSNTVFYCFLRLWYIKTLALLYLVFPILYILLKNYKVAYVSVLVFAVSIVGTVMLERQVFTWTLSRLPVFYLGMVVALNKLTNRKSMLPVGMMIFLVACLLEYISFKNVLDKLDLYILILLALSIPSVCYLLSKLKNILLKVHLFSFIEYVGRHSLELLVWHALIFQYVDKVSENDSVKFTFAFISTFLMCYLSSLLYNCMSSYVIKMKSLFKYRD